jgi:hypothetical protein
MVFLTEVKGIDPSGAAMDQCVTERTRQPVVTASDEKRVARIRSDFSAKFDRGRMVFVFGPAQIAIDPLAGIGHQRFKFSLGHEFRVPPSGWMSGFLVIIRVIAEPERGWR